MDQTPISTPDQRKPRKEKAGQTGVGGDLINSIKGNKSIMRGRPGPAGGDNCDLE